MIFDENRVSFLDIDIYRGEDHNLCTSLFRKLTAGTLLRTSSFHAKNLINSIPYVRHNCSDEVTYKIEAKKWRDRLLQRGYSHGSLKKAYKQASLKTRHRLLHSQNLNKDVDCLRIITKFTNQHENIKCMVSKNWHVIVGPSFESISTHTSFTFRRAPSIRYRLVTSEYKGEFRKDPCKHKRYL